MTRVIAIVLAVFMLLAMASSLSAPAAQKDAGPAVFFLLPGYQTPAMPLMEAP